MKKLISLLICIGIIFTIFSFSAAADSGCKIGCGHISDAAGRIVAVPVSVSSDNGIYVIRIIADYDETALNFIKIEKNYENKLNYTVNNKDGIVTVVADAREIGNVQIDGEMFKFQFEIKENTKNGTYPIKLSGDATMIEENGSGFKAQGLSVGFSAGSVKVICKEHNFSVAVKGGKKCADCDSIKQSSGNVVVPVIKNEPDKATDKNESSSVKSEGSAEEEKEVYIEPGKTVIIENYQSADKQESGTQQSADKQESGTQQSADKQESGMQQSADEDVSTKEYTGTVNVEDDEGGNEKVVLIIILAVAVVLFIALLTIFIVKFKKSKKEAE